MWYLYHKLVADHLMVERLGKLPIGARLLREHGVRPYAVLDAGCGSGHDLFHLKIPCMKALYLDIDRHGLMRLVRRFRPRALKAGRLVSAVTADLDAAPLPLADDVFDMVLCFEVLEHLSQDKRSLGELVRVLRPGGYLFLSLPLPPGVIHSRENDPWGHKREGYTVEQAKQLMTRTGIAVLEMRTCLFGTSRRILRLIGRWRTRWGFYPPGFIALPVLLERMLALVFKSPCGAGPTKLGPPLSLLVLGRKPMGRREGR